MPRLAPVTRATLPESAGSSVMVRVLLVERSAGDVQHLAGDEAGRVAREEGDGVGDVVRLADPRDRDLGGGRGLEVLEAHADACGGGGGHVGGDEAGGDGVGGDAEL